MKKICLSSFEQAIEITKQKLKDLGSPKIAFVGQRASDFLIFKDLVPLAAVICLDFGRDGELIDDFIPVISLEKNGNTRKQWYSTELFNLFKDQALVPKISGILPPGSLLLPYSSTKELEIFADAQKMKLLNNPVSIRKKFENKIKLFKLKKELDLPCPSLLLCCSAALKFEEVRKNLGEKFVLQFANGSSGTTTFIIKSKAEFKSLVENPLNKNQEIVITKFISGPTISLNGVITKKQVLFMPPSFQVIGNPETATKLATFSGVDFSALENPDLKNKAITLAAKVALKMKNEGYLGVFNLNIMAEELVLTDINARFMGSGQLSSELQIMNNEIPIALIHLMTFLEINFVISQEMVKKIGDSKKGAFIVLHSLEKQPSRVSANLNPGFYGINNGRLFFKRFGLQFKNILPEEILISSSIPQKGKLVEPDAPLLRIFTREPVLDKQTLKLNQKIKEISQAIYKSLRFTAL